MIVRYIDVHLIIITKNNNRHSHVVRSSTVMIYVWPMSTQSSSTNIAARRFSCCTPTTTTLPLFVRTADSFSAQDSLLIICLQDSRKTLLMSRFRELMNPCDCGRVDTARRRQISGTTTWVLWAVVLCCVDIAVTMEPRLNKGDRRIIVCVQDANSDVALLGPSRPGRPVESEVHTWHSSSLTPSVRYRSQSVVRVCYVITRQRVCNWQW